MATLFLLGGLVAPEIKAQQKGQPFRQRKADDSPYTKEEQKAYYSQKGEFIDSMRNERVRLVNGFMVKHGEKMRVTTSNIGWTVDKTHWVEKKEFSVRVINEYRLGNKIMRDVIAQKTTGYYSLFSYNGWSEIIDDPSCMNLQIVLEEKKSGETGSIYEIPGNQFNSTEKPCTEWYEYDSVTRVFFAPKEEEESESYAYFRQNYVPIGDYTGYGGFDQQYYQRRFERSSSNNSNGSNNKDCKCACDPFPKSVLKNSYSIHVKRLVPCGQQGERTVCLTLVEEPKQTKKKRGGFWRILGRIFLSVTFTGGSNVGSGGLGANDRLYPRATSNDRVYPGSTTNDRVYPGGLK